MVTVQHYRLARLPLDARRPGLGCARLTIHMIDDSTYREFINEVPIAVIHFSATWSGVDDQMREIIQSAADEFGGTVNICELDVDENHRTASELNILTVPTLIYYRDGQIIEKAPGLARNKNAAERIKSLLR
jgi:thioredoxin 1